MKVNSWLMMGFKLEQEARKFLKEAYNLELEVPVLINGRLKSTYGRFVHNRVQKRPVKIEISKNYIEHQEFETVRETLLHECIHYALYMKGLPYKDGHPVFEAELKKWGSHSTGTVKYHGKVVQYACPSCGYTYNKKKRYPRNRAYHSGCCNKPIKFIGEKIV
ncbi:SprT-like domain-containing protein [Peribacillus asahii]|uniref:SprT-like domain-containing protein n=1 Tax=Peribacillus asahii TaxID=228899 RepID=UPI0038175204